MTILKGTEPDEAEPDSPPAGKGPGKRITTFLGPFSRFAGYWFGFTGLYAMFALCPFCGQQGCAVGLASAGTFGAVFAFFMRSLRRLMKSKGPAKRQDGNPQSRSPKLETPDTVPPPNPHAGPEEP